MITGPDEGAAANRGHLRVAHTDRERVIDLLKAAFVQGRLTKDELDERAGHALTARTYAQLAALTDDIPAGAPAACPARLPAPQRHQPKRTHPVRNTAVGSVSCLTAGFVSFWYGASLDDHSTLAFLRVTLVALIVAIVILVYGIGTAVTARRSGGRLPPGPGQALEEQRRGSTGEGPSAPAPGIGTAAGTDQTRADLRAHRSQPRPRGQGVPAARGARPGLRGGSAYRAGLTPFAGA